MSAIGTPRILVADDEPALLNVLTQYLTRLGYAVVPCHSGSEAWAEFSSAPASFSLFIADATLDECEHPDLLERMGKRDPSLQFLICSGYPFDVSSLPPDVRHRTQFLQKPFTPVQLAEYVGRLVHSS